MALPTVEFVIAPSTEAFRANPRDAALTEPILEIMKTCEGMIRLAHLRPLIYVAFAFSSTTFGLQHEDKTSAYCAVVWHSLGDHKALMNDSVKHMKVGEALQAILDPMAITMFHCAFNSEPYKALQAPVTEIITITLHEGESKDTLEELVEELAHAANISPPESGAVSAAWGPSTEKDDVFFLMIGWTSVEAHYTLVKAWPEVLAIIERIKAIATVEVKHVALA
ncbi:hypothetical protein GSI_07252 [Ganoderma sinense ZZ0214-1]|uniref:ABM domain-containing protein n=1 Tax=Ganoderma sinense ZZ0214-1 TaxID=1077348 RepID=A0A2G8S9W5_9APHY|nr:hypothetical protein GSI_07252 [Ganoderma sinense ZZ0214-1]